MSARKSYAKPVVISLIVTVLIVALLVYGFVSYLIPRYSIEQNQIYSVAVKLFPLFVGLLMIEAGVVIAHRKDNEEIDQADILPPNAYDEPLGRLPNDDPSMVRTQGSEPHVQPGYPQEAAGAAAADTLIAPPLAAEGDAAVKRQMTFDEVLDTELKSAQDVDYDLTLVLATSAEDKKELVADKLGALADSASYPFTLEDGTEALIFPFFTKEETINYLEPVVAQVREEVEDSDLKLAYATRAGRAIEGSVLMGEAIGEL